MIYDNNQLKFFLSFLMPPFVNKSVIAL